MSKEFEDAIRMLEEALQKKPDDIEIHERLLKALVRSRCFSKVPGGFVKMVHTKPLWTQFHYEIMMTLVFMGAGTSIRQEFQVLTGRDPREVFYWYGLGLVSQALTDQRAAVMAYRAAIEADPSYAPAYHNLGIALRLSGKESEALACHEKAISICPNLAEAYYALGVMYMKPGQYLKAKSYFAEFVRVAPPYLDTYVQEAEQSLLLLSRATRT